MKLIKDILINGRNNASLTVPVDNKMVPLTTISLITASCYMRLPEEENNMVSNRKLNKILDKVEGMNGTGGISIDDDHFVFLRSQVERLVLAGWSVHPPIIMEQFDQAAHDDDEVQGSP